MNSDPQSRTPILILLAFGAALIALATRAEAAPQPSRLSDIGYSRQ